MVVWLCNLSTLVERWDVENGDPPKAHWQLDLVSKRLCLQQDRRWGQTYPMTWAHLYTHVNSHTYKYTNIYIIQISACPHTEEGEGERTRERLNFLCFTYFCLFIQYGTPALGIVPSYPGWDSSPPLIPHRHVPSLSSRWSKPCQVDNADNHVQTHPCALRDCLQCLEESLPDKAFSTWECRGSEIQVTGALPSLL